MQNNAGDYNKAFYETNLGMQATKKIMVHYSQKPCKYIIWNPLPSTFKYLANKNFLHYLSILGQFHLSHPQPLLSFLQSPGVASENKELNVHIAIKIESVFIEWEVKVSLLAVFEKKWNYLISEFVPTP